MSEEDVMETSIMHLCIPDYERKEKDGVMVPSGCSYYALSVLLNEKSDWNTTHRLLAVSYNDMLHFPLVTNIIVTFSLNANVSYPNQLLDTQFHAPRSSFIPTLDTSIFLPLFQSKSYRDYSILFYSIKYRQNQTMNSRL